jgi:hypothetical protein
MLRIFPCYPEEPKNSNLVTVFSVASSANSIRTNVEAQLVAGVAHEINNSVSFIYNQIVHVNLYVLDLFNLI